VVDVVKCTGHKIYWYLCICFTFQGKEVIQEVPQGQEIDITDMKAVEVEGQGQRIGINDH
jgi:hypothetical protein